MKINQETLAEMTENCRKIWNRFTELNPTLKSNLTESNTGDLWFRTWASVAYDDSNPNVIRNSNGERVLEYNPRYEMYPCDSDDLTMKAAYKRIHKALTN